MEASLKKRVELDFPAAERLRLSNIFLSWEDDSVHVGGGDFFVWPALVRPVEAVGFEDIAHAAGVLEWCESFTVPTAPGAPPATVVTSNPAFLEEFWEEGAAQLHALGEGEPLTVSFAPRSLDAPWARPPPSEWCTWPRAFKLWVELPWVDIGDTYATPVTLRTCDVGDGKLRTKDIMRGIGYRCESGITVYIERG